MERQETGPGIEALSREQAIAMELWEGINARSDWLALHPATVAATIERYEGDGLGAAMATDITHALAAELPLDGSLDDTEAEPIDGIVAILRSNGLAGIGIEDLSEVLRVDLNMGALDGIMTMHAMLSDASLGNVELLRERFAVSDVAEAETAEEYQEYIEHRNLALDDELPMIDGDWGDDDEEEPVGPTLAIVTDESGEEFEI